MPIPILDQVELPHLLADEPEARFTDGDQVRIEVEREFGVIQFWRSDPSNEGIGRLVELGEWEAPEEPADKEQRILNLFQDKEIVHHAWY